jgi:hypothetical protein
METSGGSLVFEVSRETTDYSLVLTDIETGLPIVAWTGSVDAADLPTLDITEINAFASTPADHVQVSVGVENGDPGVETTVPIVSVRKSWGERYTMTNGVQVELSAPRTTVRSLPSDDEPEESALSESQEYLAVEITAWNPADWPQRAPALDWFELDAKTTWRDHRPLDASTYDEPGREKVYENDSLRGTLYFSVPDSTFAPDSNCRGAFPVDENRTELVEWGPVTS